VYWGQLWDGSQIAVKRLKAWSSREEIDFAVEVEILARIRHKNLLSVRGYCEEGQERLIVYEYMPNLSLVSHLHGQHSSESLLDWTRRMNIAVTSAQAIAYLHHHATPKIVHGDVRASNVLLDTEFEARVTDFGYGKLMPDDAGDGAAKTTKGNNSNLGYLSPECVESGKESEMGDVYSYGVVLLELVTGKRPVEKVNQTTKLGLTERVLPLVYDRKFGEIVDQKLNGKYVEEELKRVVLVGLLCAQSEPERRPTMSEVVEMLMNESKEKMAYIEANPLFNRISNGGDVTDESSEIIPQKQEQE
jgi:serine/threonine protein kinase